MADLQKLTELDGFQAAFRMTDRGELIEHHIAEGSHLNETSLDLIAHMCVANVAIATMQARGWEANSSSQGFYPINGFTLVGMEWSAVTNNNLGVILANKNVDYEKAYELLGQLGGEA